jgi:glycosyltransferase involved in cell wall biosynthesis
LEEAFREQGFSNIQYIPNVVDLGHLPYLPRKKCTYKLLWVRRLQALYHPKMALEVLKLLKDQGIEAALCMVGADYDGLLTALQEFTRSHELKVNFMGQLSQQEWMQLSQDYSIFLNTTQVDNTPLSVMEAMALGLAVVSTNVGGIPYLVEDAKEGLLVAPNDVEAMAAAVVRLVEDPELFKSITTAARQKVEQFDWEVVKHQWVELIEHTVNGDA